MTMSIPLVLPETRVGFQVRYWIVAIISKVLPPILAQFLREKILPVHEMAGVSLEKSCISITGSVFRGELRDYPSYPFLVQGYFTWRNLALCLALTKKGDTVVEVGANVGTETVGFSDIVGANGHVIALEPLPANYRRLLINATSVRHANITTLQCAAGDHEGEVRIIDHIPGVTTSMSKLDPLEEADSGDVAGKVPLRRLDEIIENADAVSVIFIDTEGSEPYVLRGAEERIRSRRPSLVVEAHANLLEAYDHSLDTLYEQLSSYGYKIYSIGRFVVRQCGREAIPSKSDWLCIHETKCHAVHSVNRKLLTVALSTPLLGINPLSRVGRSIS